MGSNYFVKISDVAVVFDGPHATPKKIDAGPYFLSISSLEGGMLDLSKSAHLSDEEFIKWTKRVTPQQGDVLFSYETRLGEAALMPVGVKACLGRRMGLLRPNLEKVIPEYLLYAYLSPEFQQEIKKRTIHGATVDRIALKELPDFNIRIPPLDEQRRVVDTLNSINSKLTVNRQINQTLEQMAQALFKSWFVDFDPVVDNALDAGFFEQVLDLPDELLRRAEARKTVRAQAGFKPLPAATRQLFPAAFEPCDEPSLGLGGWVPKGWTGRPIKTLCVKVQNGGTPNRSNPEYWDNGHIPWLTSGEVRQSIITSVVNNITTNGLINSSAKWVDSRSTLVALYGATAGEVSINSEALTTNQAVCALIPKENYCWFNYLQVRNKTKEMQSNAVGSAQQNISKGLVESLMVISPPLSIVEAFHHKAEPLFVKAIANNKMQVELANLRDTLLPKLISGELSLDEFEVTTQQGAA